jgi:hypothetical protein
MVHEGPVGETLALQAGPMGETVSKHVVISGLYTKGSVKNGKNVVF